MSVSTGRMKRAVLKALLDNSALTGFVTALDRMDAIAERAATLVRRIPMYRIAFERYHVPGTDRATRYHGSFLKKYLEFSSLWRA